MTERLLALDDVELCVEAFGDPADPTILLLAGAACSMDHWDVELCERLAAGGRHVVRYDHRDTGRSTASPPGAPTYTGRDLTEDPIRILDALGVERAHLVGLSMGGGMAQDLAARHADRVSSITLIATSAAGERADDAPLPGPEPQVTATFADPPPDPDWEDRAAVIEHLVDGERPYAGSLGLDEARARRIAATIVDRTPDPRTAANHWAVADGPDASFRLADLAVPTLVLHGTADPFFPIAHGRALAAEIPGARLIELDGMGHQTPPKQFWDTIVPAILALG